MTLTTEEMAKHLQRYLEDEDAPCPVCGYNLRHLQGTRCPECGATMELRVGSVDLKLGRWLAMVLTFALPFGLGLLPVTIIWTVVGVNAAQQGYWSDFEEVVSNSWPLLVLALVAGLFLILAIGRRRRFWRLKPQKQTVWLAAAVVLMAAAIGGTLVLMNG